jgi:hypothetical protein
MLVAATRADLAKFAQPPLYLAAPPPMRESYVLDCYWFSDFFHRFNSILNLAVMSVNEF